MQSYEATGKWYAVEHMVLVYLYWRKYTKTRDTGKATSLSEVMEEIRPEHTRNCLESALEEVGQGNAKDVVLEEYIGIKKPPP